MRSFRPAAALAMACAFFPAPAPAEEAPPTWLFVTFERPVSELRALLGDPVELTRLPEPGAPPVSTRPPERKARYLLSFAGPTFMVVSERHGVVVGIEAFPSAPPTAEEPTIAPDPSGVRVGAPEAAVTRAHPDAKRLDTAAGSALVSLIGSRYVASYVLHDGRVSAISWFARPETDPPGDAPPFTEPAGDSPATAILDARTNEREGVLWEIVWQRYHPCAGTIDWLKTSVATSLQNGRRYDAVTLKCPTTGTTRTVYFDITAFFGRF
jgi:hypothetical protein